ncbi:hypothetical protein OF83DRAFT_330481 [Amylostereum chailletii]|nr:hypothetical protein OF83DRAFT_330481 [Amylostereum chailletii]
MPRRRTAELQEPNPLHFAKSTTGWRCTVCPSAPSGHVDVYSTSHALRHEQSDKHTQAVETHDPWTTTPRAADWGDANLEKRVTDDWNALERRDWVDRVPEKIGFWRRGVEAAARGEEPDRWQAFLESLDEEKKRMEHSLATDAYGPANDWGWGPAANEVVNDWAAPPGAWGIPEWDRPMEDSSIKVQDWKQPHRSWESNSLLSDNSVPDGTPEGMDSFVENYARRQAVGSAKKVMLQTFSKMPTDQKVDKIQEMINSLRT